MKDDPFYKECKVGKYTYGTPIILIFNVAKFSDLEVGAFTSIALNTTIILDGEHRKEYVSTYPFDAIFLGKYKAVFSKGPVKIGNDVWIGEGALILSGVTIGDGAVIGARTVVRGDVPPYSIVLGNPAKVVGYRFEKKDIDRLLKVKWWDWDIEKIKSFIPLLFSKDIKEFLNKAEEP